MRSIYIFTNLYLTDQNLSIFRYPKKNFQKSTILEISKIFVLYNNNVEKLLQSW